MVIRNAFVGSVMRMRGLRGNVLAVARRRMMRVVLLCLVGHALADTARRGRRSQQEKAGKKSRQATTHQYNVISTQPLLGVVHQNSVGRPEARPAALLLASI